MTVRNLCSNLNVDCNIRSHITKPCKIAKVNYCIYVIRPCNITFNFKVQNNRAVPLLQENIMQKS